MSSTSIAAPGYQFPTEKLRAVDPLDPRQPLIIVACGSFSPITYLHARMFEMAKDHLKFSALASHSKQEQYPGPFQILGGYLSPVNDAYDKNGLCAAIHRVAMAQLLCEGSSWLMVDPWESLYSGTTFKPTAHVLDHFASEINDVRVADVLFRNVVDTERRAQGIRVMLLAGGDLIESFQTPGLWDESDLHHILGTYGCLVLERKGADTHSFLLENDILNKYRRNVYVIKQLIHNDISSTKVRLFIKRGFSIRYLVDDKVVEYIYTNRLFTE